MFKSLHSHLFAMLLTWKLCISSLASFKDIANQKTISIPSYTILPRSYTIRVAIPYDPIRSYHDPVRSYHDPVPLRLFYRSGSIHPFGIMGSYDPTIRIAILITMVTTHIRAGPRQPHKEPPSLPKSIYQGIVRIYIIYNTTTTYPTDVRLGSHRVNVGLFCVCDCSLLLSSFC